MKKILTLALVLLFVNLAQSQEQWTLVTKRTAEWCGNCGTWGWSTFKTLVEDLEDENAIVVAMHTSSSDLTTQTSIDLLANIGGNGQPRFYVNMDDYGVSSGNTSAKIDEIKGDVSFLNSLPPVISVEVNGLENVDSRLYADATVEVSEELNGEYRLGIYVIQDHVIASQSGQGSNADHRNLLTESFFENALGEVIGDGVLLEAGSTHTFEADIPIPSNFDFTTDKLAAIIWRQLENGQYIFINGGMDREFEIVSNTNEIEKSLTEFNVFQNQQSQIEVSLNAQKDLGEVQINLLDLQGKLIQSTAQSIQKGSSKVFFETNDINAGIYVVSISNASNHQAKQISIVK